MPLMHSHDGKSRIVPVRAIPGYLERDWTVAGGDVVDEKPAQSDRKDVWVAYAITQGYDDAEGLTKDELIERYG